MICVSYAFKFADLASMNQGCIVCLFSVTSIYIAILFYFKFNETISWCKIAGMLLMIFCILTLSLTPKEEETRAVDDSHVSGVAVVNPEDYRHYRYYAVLVAITAPFLWTFQAYSLRQCLERGDFNLFDLVIDTAIWLYTAAFCIFISYATSMTPTEEFDWRAFGYGQLVGVLFFAGDFLCFYAYKGGPGGPINTLI